MLPQGIRAQQLMSSSPDESSDDIFDMDLDELMDVRRSTVGLVYYPNARLNPMFNFKISKSIIHDDGTGDREDEFVAQCVIGF